VEAVERALARREDLVAVLAHLVGRQAAGAAAEVHRAAAGMEAQADLGGCVDLHFE